MPVPERPNRQAGLGTVLREWTRLGITGFGGPPAHLTLLRRLCLERNEWLSPAEFEDGLAAANLLPGPSSTQMAIFCAWRVAGWPGALVGGACFILPGLAIIIVLASFLLARHPATWLLGAATGAGAAVPLVALNAALGLIPASWKRVSERRSRQARWCAYLLAGGVAGALAGEYLVLVLVAAGLIEVGCEMKPKAPPATTGVPAWWPALASLPVAGGLGALALVAFKVGALSYGGGFVIIPLMQHDAVTTYHFMTKAQFLYAVALGQVTPGPVVQTVAVVGYAARGVAGALFASAIAFAPSFVFVLGGARHFGRLRASGGVQAFLTGGGAAAIGAIAGASIPLALGISHLWQLGVAALAAVWLLGFRRSVVVAILSCAALGVIAVLAGAPVGGH